ncbi:MAG: translation initiation factor IF-2 associated domain-containing protein, partial [Pseudoxanthomonas sp.]
MSQQTTIRKLAELVNTPVDKLIEQLAEAGMKFSDPDQAVSSTEKMKLLGFLRRTHGKSEGAEEVAAPKKITLARRKVQEVTVKTGRSAATVNVEVRQKRTYVKPVEEAVRPPPLPRSTDPGIDPERAEILRKLEESKQRNLDEQRRLAEIDRQRAEELERKRQEEAAARAEAEAATVAATGAEEAAPAEAARAPKSAGAHAPRPPAPRKEAERAAPGPRHKNRGSHAMVAGVEDDDAASRFAGQLHLSAADRARRGATRGKPRPAPRR